MKIIITGRRMELTKKISQYVRKKFGKWSLFLGPAAEVHVVLAVENYRHQAEVTAKDGRYQVTGRQITKDMYQSIDLLVEKIGGQLARQHERLKGNKIRTDVQVQKGLMPEPPAAPKRNKFEVETMTGKPMTPEEAMLQLQNLRQPFLVFEEMESGELAVMVKNRDGSFKLIVKE